MPKDPSSNKSLSLLAQAAKNAGEQTGDPRMAEAGDRMMKLLEKAAREGKRGLVEVDGVSVIVDW